MLLQHVYAVQQLEGYLKEGVWMHSYHTGNRKKVHIHDSCSASSHNDEINK